jgi:D-alanine-D-alanine ligase
MSAPRAIAVLFGGSSAEREVSIESGNAVAAALKSRGHRVELIDPAVTPVAAVDWNCFDAAFIALHGTYGEDGQVQKELDALGVAYTGSSAAASARAFDKNQAKIAFRSANIPTPDSKLISPGDSFEANAQAAELVGYPIVIKPCSQGSSVGVSIVREPSQLAAAITECFRHDAFGLIERAVVGEEWTVGVIGDRALSPIRIESARDFYDYEAKYNDNRTGYHQVDSDTDPKQVDALQQVSLRACAALETSGIARVDLMLDSESVPWVLEVNTVPGFTSHSLIPKAAATAGMNLGELCEAAIPGSPGMQRLAG